VAVGVGVGKHATTSHLYVQTILIIHFFFKVKNKQYIKSNNTDAGFGVLQWNGEGRQNLSKL